MDFIKKHSFRIIIGSAILTRLILLFLDFSFDVHNHIAWGKDLVEVGISGFYEVLPRERYGTIYPNYPPLINYIFAVLYFLYDLIVKVEWWVNTTIPAFPSKLVFFIESRTFAAGLFKLPSIAADFGIAWILYLFAKKIAPQDKYLKSFIFASVLLNPAYFYNSSFWGQLDSIPLFFVLVAFYVLWFRKMAITSGLFFMAALLIKPNIVVFLPLFALIFIMKRSIKDIVKTVGASFIFFWLSFLPFYKTGNIFTFPFRMYTEKILGGQILTFVTNGAFNWWVLLTGFKEVQDTQTLFLSLSYQIWGYIIVALLFFLITIGFLRKKDTKTLVFAGFLMSFASFLFLTKMHERYSMLFLPFLLLLVIKNRKMMKWYILLSTISFLNLFHNWRAINVEILKQAIAHPSVGLTLSIVNLSVFFYLLFIYLRNQNPTNKG